MPATLESPPQRHRRRRIAPPATDHARRRQPPPPTTIEVLASYVEPGGCARQVVARPAAAGSLLVIDRAAPTLDDCRLVAHLGGDEPPANARLVCDLYLADARRCCRPLRRADVERAPAWEREPAAATPAPGDQLVDARGGRYRLQRVTGGSRAAAEIRWVRSAGHDAAAAARIVSLRAVVGALEAYEPARAMTAATARRLGDDPEVSVVALTTELARLARSPTVLNRLLREAVLRALRTRDLTMSLIALRCGRVKRDRHGNVSGETSWLARRVGLMPEGGADAPTPWVHGGVLALIARRGLGVDPQEVELA